MEKLLIIDGNSIINRAFYGIRLLTNSKGMYTNAIYGFLNIMLKHMEDISPEYVAVAFDLKAPTFRHKMYDKYKAQRKGMPEELKMQMPVMKEVRSAMNVTILEKEGFEADDIIGTVSRMCKDSEVECFVLTGDKDDLQLATDTTKITATLKVGKAITAGTAAKDLSRNREDRKLGTPRSIPNPSSFQPSRSLWESISPVQRSSADRKVKNRKRF